jgi:hypothetical protein
MNFGYPELNKKILRLKKKSKKREELLSACMRVLMAEPYKDIKAEIVKCKCSDCLSIQKEINRIIKKHENHYSEK